MKQVVFRCETEDYKKLKLYCILNNITTTDFFINQIKEKTNDLEKTFAKELTKPIKERKY